MDFIINESHLSLKSMAITYYYLSLICSYGISIIILQINDKI